MNTYKLTTGLLTTILALGLIFIAQPIQAQGFGGGNGFGGVGEFIDEDGDGFNDLAPDADGDGIPNGLDEDYVPPQDGTGQAFGPGMGTGECDGEGPHGPQNGQGNGNGGYGPGNGIGNGGVGPADGTGFGPGTGDCLNNGATMPMNSKRYSRK